MTVTELLMSQKQGAGQIHNTDQSEQAAHAAAPVASQGTKQIAIEVVIGLGLVFAVIYGVELLRRRK